MFTRAIISWHATFFGSKIQVHSQFLNNPIIGNQDYFPSKNFQTTYSTFSKLFRLLSVGQKLDNLHP